MPVIVNQISSPLSADEKSIFNNAVKALGIDKKRVLECHIHKTSLDARKRNDIHFVHSVFIKLDDGGLEKKLCENNPKLTYAAQGAYEPVIAKCRREGRVVIAGFGPAGMFCGLALAEQGYKPIILERGGDVDSRTAKVQNFWNSGELDINSNVQFGEGGAGTFSDGKLTTRIKDPLCQYVLKRFADFGAPEEILTKAKPHIGTDNLRKIVKAIRTRIIELGGEVRFEEQLLDFTVKNSSVEKAVCKSEEISVSALVLAIGHSARDTFELLASKGIFLEPKPFSVGARIEHKQSAVDESLYGAHAGNPLLPKGEYQLSYRNRSGRGVYTFCMCPGGTVVPSASEKGGVITNGMSEFARDGKNANAAVVVSVTPADFGSGVLDGVDFARKIERNAYAQSDGYKACGTTVKGFLEDKPSLNGTVAPTYVLGLTASDYGKIFPKFVTDMMKTGLNEFSRKMKCFGDGGAMLSAPETRTSSPVRITRGENMTSLSCTNLYPCGEGAGYAGGIMSAAVDGIKTALKIMSEFAPNE
ncbi:MAG: hypothetical protein Q4E74_00040 [Ruminococcus sp.]|nr:hypothetical protein [Ruminococcus sp.]